MTQAIRRPKWPLFVLLGLCLACFLFWWAPVFPLVGALAASLFGVIALCLGPWWLLAGGLCFMACCGFGSWLFYGLPLAVGAGFSFLSLLPGALCALLARRRVPFFTLVQALGFSSLALLLAGYGLLYLLLGDPIAYLGQEISRSIEALPAELQTLMFYASSNLGLTSGQDLDYTKVLDAAQLDRLREELVGYMELSYRLSLPTLFVSWAANCAVFVSYLPLRALASLGQAQTATEMPELTKLRISRKANLGMLGAVAVGWLLTLLVGGSMYAVSQAIWELVLIAYAVQGVAVTEWFLKRRGMGRVGRLLLIALGVLFLRYVLFFIGLLEQLLYFRGFDKPTPPGNEGN